MHLRNFFEFPTRAVLEEAVLLPQSLTYYACSSSSKMSSDEIVWQVINQQFCSYKLKYTPTPLPTPPTSALLTSITDSTPNPKTSAAMNTMSPASATGSPVPSQTPAMLPSVPTPPPALYTSTSRPPSEPTYPPNGGSASASPPTTKKPSPTSTRN